MQQGVLPSLQLCVKFVIPWIPAVLWSQLQCDAEEINPGAKYTQKALLMQLGRNQTKSARNIEAWSLHSFVATGMKIKSKRLLTSELEEWIHFIRAERGSREHTWLERKTFAAPLQTLLVGQQASLHSMELTFSCCPAHSFHHIYMYIYILQAAGCTAKKTLL